MTNKTIKCGKGNKLQVYFENTKSFPALHKLVAWIVFPDDDEPWGKDHILDDWGRLCGISSADSSAQNCHYQHISCLRKQDVIVMMPLNA